MRIFLFLLFVSFSVRGEVSIKRPTSKIHYLCFISDILVVSYALSCAEPAESDSCSAYSASAVAARRQNGVAVPQRASARGILFRCDTLSTRLQRCRK